VKAIRFNESTLEKFREDIKRVTSSTGEFLIACYNRKHVGQTGTGHFAPVAGYHEASDKVLLLDVARFKYPPHWVTVPLLFGAMKDIDPDTEKPRGYFLLSGQTNQTPNALLNNTQYNTLQNGNSNTDSIHHPTPHTNVTTNGISSSPSTLLNA